MATINLALGPIMIVSCPHLHLILHHYVSLCHKLAQTECGKSWTISNGLLPSTLTWGCSHLYPLLTNQPHRRHWLFSLFLIGLIGQKIEQKGYWALAWTLSEYFAQMLTNWRRNCVAKLTSFANRVLTAFWVLAVDQPIWMEHFHFLWFFITSPCEVFSPLSLSVLSSHCCSSWMSHPGPYHPVSQRHSQAMRYVGMVQVPWPEWVVISLSDQNHLANALPGHYDHHHHH